MATNYVLQHSGKEIDNLLNKVSNIPEYTFQVVNELPTENINKNTVYIVQTGVEECDEYIRIGQHWEKLGSEKKLKTLSTNSIYQRGMFIYTYDPNMEMGYEAPSESTEGLPEYTFIKVSDGTELAKCRSYAHLFDYILYQVGQYISGADTQTLTDGIYLVSPFNQDSMANLYRGSNLLGINLKWSHRANWSHKYVSTFGEESYITFSIANSKTTIHTHNYEIVLRTREAQDYDGLRLVISMNSVTPIEHPAYATEPFVQTEIANLINSAPETLDTLGEIATAIKDNEDIIDTLNAAIGTKANKSDIPSLTGYATETYVTNAVSSKVEKTYVDTELEKKANKTEIPNLTNYATKEYVDTELENAAGIASDEIKNIVQLTQAEYDALDWQDINTLYIILNPVDYSNKTIKTRFPANIGNTWTANLRPGTATTSYLVFQGSNNYRIEYTVASNANTGARYIEVNLIKINTDGSKLVDGTFYYWHSVNGESTNTTSYTLPSTFGTVTEKGTTAIAKEVAKCFQII